MAVGGERSFTISETFRRSFSRERTPNNVPFLFSDHYSFFLPSPDETMRLTTIWALFTVKTHGQRCLRDPTILKCQSRILQSLNKKNKKRLFK